MDQVANAIAVIGVYFALMAVLAVSVEAVIGWFKVPIPWLQGNPSPDDVLNEVKGWLTPDEQASIPDRIVALNKSLKAIGQVELSPTATVSQVVEAIGLATTLQQQQDRVRQAVIRVMAIVLGIVFALLFQTDTLQILAPLSATAQATWQATLGPTYAHRVGLALSGLAASAGSSFWHDQSVRLRQLKSLSEAAGGLVGQ